MTPQELRDREAFFSKFTLDGKNEERKEELVQFYKKLIKKHKK